MCVRRHPNVVRAYTRVCACVFARTSASALMPGTADRLKSQVHRVAVSSRSRSLTPVQVHAAQEERMTVSWKANEERLRAAPAQEASDVAHLKTPRDLKPQSCGVLHMTEVFRESD